MAQYDGMAKGSLQSGDAVRFVATVIATADVDLMALARTYETAISGDALRERLGLVIGVNGRTDRERKVVEAVEEFASSWEREGTFSVSVTGFTWRQPNPGRVAAGGLKEIPYGALREAVVRDTLTRQMLDRLKPDAAHEVYLHIGDADVRDMVKDGRPLFDRATAKLAELAHEREDMYPELVSGGYTLPEGPAKNAADLDLRVRDAMARSDARAIYFPEPNTFVRVRLDGSRGLEKKIGFGTKDGNSFSYEAREGERLLDSVVATRRETWWDREHRMVVFDSALSLVTDGGRIARDVDGSHESLLKGLTQSHANRKTWTEQVERYIVLHHGHVLASDAQVGKTLAAIAFHGVRADGTRLEELDEGRFRKAVKVELASVARASGGSDTKAFRQLARLATLTYKALVSGVNNRLEQSVSSSGPRAEGAGDGEAAARITQTLHHEFDELRAGNPADRPVDYRLSDEPPSLRGQRRTAAQALAEEQRQLMVIRAGIRGGFDDLGPHFAGAFKTATPKLRLALKELQDRRKEILNDYPYKIGARGGLLAKNDAYRAFASEMLDRLSRELAGRKPTPALAEVLGTLDAIRSVGQPPSGSGVPHLSPPVTFFVAQKRGSRPPGPA
ncbi:hypothetical protein AB0D38_38425 [Streptomyces sp. NPDC048279]|uniref:hypothetical protein n=1 Tax=Streptomyces sp. NPDC048279 TaxID=3154714 RepID=UPI0034447B18